MVSVRIPVNPLWKLSLRKLPSFNWLSSSEISRRTHLRPDMVSFRQMVVSNEVLSQLI
jgi:hypothetical protein